MLPKMKLNYFVFELPAKFLPSKSATAKCALSHQTWRWFANRWHKSCNWNFIALHVLYVWLFICSDTFMILAYSIAIEYCCFLRTVHHQKHRTQRQNVSRIDSITSEITATYKLSLSLHLVAFEYSPCLTINAVKLFRLK